MDNIEIKKGQHKRSVESLIDSSIIDHSFNHEANELRKAFNRTIRDLNTKIKEQERELNKLSLLSNQKDEIIAEQLDRIHKIENQMADVLREDGEVKKSNVQLRNRLHHVEYRLQMFEDNRIAAQKVDADDQITDTDLEEIKKKEKQAAYQEIAQIMQKKVGKFTKEVKNYAMSIELENSIETFLQEILYLNPQNVRQHVFNANQNKNRKVGRISDRKQHAKLSEMDQWRKLQKSLQKLRNARNSPLPHSSSSRNILQKQKVADEGNKQMHKLLINYV